MSLLDGPLARVFGIAFGAVFRAATLRKTRETDGGHGGFATAFTDYPVKVSADALGAADRAASGLPLSAVRFTILVGGLAVIPDLDDEITLDGTSYRLIKVDTDPAGASVSAAAVPL